MAFLFNMTTDQIINYDSKVPKGIGIEDKTVTEQMRIIAELDEKDKYIVFGMIETMLTQKSSKTFIIIISLHSKTKTPS